MFIFKNDRLKAKMKEAFVEKAVAINDISDTHITLSEMEKAFEEGFKTGLNIEFKPLELSEQQLAEVKELEEKYRSDDWMFRNNIKIALKLSLIRILQCYFCLMFSIFSFVLSSSSLILPLIFS